VRRLTCILFGCAAASFPHLDPLLYEANTVFEYSSCSIQQRSEINNNLFPHGSTASRGPWPSHCWGFVINIRHTTLGRTPLVEWSAPRRDLYFTTHNTRKRQTSITPAGFEPVILANEWPQLQALHRAVTSIGVTMMRMMMLIVMMIIVIIIII